MFASSGKRRRSSLSFSETTPDHFENDYVDEKAQTQSMNKKTELERFQEEDRLYCDDLQRAVSLSKSSFDSEKRLRDSAEHFDSQFIVSLREKTSLRFEQFCVVVVRGYSGRCGRCAVYRDERTKRFQSTSSATEQEDPLFDFCPHLVCTEWSILPKLRSIGRVFWQRFLATRVGRAMQLCFPQCAFCEWTNMYDFGWARKKHGTCLPRLPMFIPEESRHGGDDFTPRCACRSASARDVLTEWCRCAGLDATKTVIVLPCKCWIPKELQ